MLYNSWYVTEFDVNFDNQAAAARKAAELGVELFVMDDGWFGVRDDDHSGLGDWTVDRRKFPAGLGPLIEYVNSLGMEFGIWVEPEMVNVRSELYARHPDWVYHFPNRPRSEGRNQLVLNFGREDVQDFVLDFMHDLLSQNNIHFVKWDMNRSFSEPGYPEAEPGRERELWVRHVQGLYRIFAELRQAHPQVMFESCSSGGGRIVVLHGLHLALEDASGLTHALGQRGELGGTEQQQDDDEQDPQVRTGEQVTHNIPLSRA